MNNIKFGFIALAIVVGIISMSTFIVHEREVAIKLNSVK